MKPKPRKWTRKELLLALNLYYKLPFGQLHATHPLIRRAASKMKRTPASLSMKLCNLASLDPNLLARGIEGLPNASRLDQEVWHDYHARWDTLTAEAEELAQEVLGEPTTELGRPKPRRAPKTAPKRTESEGQRKSRVGQDYFRAVVLAAYGEKCCVSGTRVPELLRASHIIPWKDDVENRLNPSNGLCLSAHHDAAFDRGLITFDSKMRLVLSDYLEGFLPDDVVEREFVARKGLPLRPPDRFEPNKRFLAWHRRNKFLDAG